MVTAFQDFDPRKLDPRKLDPRKLDVRALDLRALAEPLAVLSPVALIVSAQEVVMSGVSLLFIWQSWRIRDFGWTREPWFAALLALWAFAFARTALDHPTATGVLLALHWIHFAIFAAALAYWILPDKESRRRLLYATVATLTFYAFDCLFQFVFGFDVIGRRAWDFRLTSVFSKPGVGVEIAWLCLPASLGLWREGKPAIAAAFACACFAAVFLSGDRTGLLDLVGAGLLVGALYRPLRRPLLIFVPLVAVVATGLLILSPRMRERQINSTMSSLEHFSQSPYGVVFASGLDVAREHPVFGVGLHNYQTACLDERLGPPEVGPRHELRCQGHPHNSYLLWLAEAGSIGLVLYVAFIGLLAAAIARSGAWIAGDAVFYGLVASLALRFWPLSGGTSFFSSWSAEPLFLAIGWTLAFGGRVFRSEAADGAPAPVARAVEPREPLPLSILIRTLNEADRLPKTLRSIAALGAEVVIVDAGSQDETVAIAKSFGARVIQNPWPGFGPQRRFGEERCANDFIFSLDADEVLTEALIAEIRAAFRGGAPPRLMIVRKAAVFPHHKKPPLLAFCHEQILIYDRRVATTGPNPNWDKLEITSGERPVRLMNPLWHFSLRDLNHAVAKSIYVAQLAADTQPMRSTLLLALRLPFEFPVAFIKYYIVRRYLFAGIDGLTYGLVGAFSRFIRIAMMLERRMYSTPSRSAIAEPTK